MKIAIPNFTSRVVNSHPISFINKGVGGRWTDTLSREDSAEYESRARAELGEACARWLATGQGID